LARPELVAARVGAAELEHELVVARLPLVHVQRKAVGAAAARDLKSRK
jgi:hypothetical protein